MKKIKYSPSQIKKLIALYQKSINDNHNNTQSWQNLIDYIHDYPHLVAVNFYQNRRYNDKTTLFLKSISEDDNKLAHYLINNISHLNINQQLDSGLCALSLAVNKLNVEMVNYLISHKANIHAVNKAQHSLIHYLTPTEENLPKAKLILDLLLDKGLDINALNEIGNNALLEYSTKFSHVPFSWLKHLVEKGSDVNIINQYGYNAFLYASWKQDKKLIEYYYAQGSNPTLRNYKNEGALELCLSHTYEVGEDLKYLLTLDEIATEENLTLALNNKSLRFTLEGINQEIKKTLENQLLIIKERKHLNNQFESSQYKEKNKKIKL